MPPHILMLAVVGAGLIAGYRMAHRAMKKRAPRRQAGRLFQRTARSWPLEWDETTGAYRPRHH